MSHTIGKEYGEWEVEFQDEPGYDDYPDSEGSDESI